jgi:hypothetical protein
VRRHETAFLLVKDVHEGLHHHVGVAVADLLVEDDLLSRPGHVVHGELELDGDLSQDLGVHPSLRGADSVPPKGVLLIEHEELVHSLAAVDHLLHAAVASREPTKDEGAVLSVVDDVLTTADLDERGGLCEVTERSQQRAGSHGYGLPRVLGLTASDAH